MAIRDKIISRLALNARRNFTTSDLADALRDMSQADRDDMIAAIRQGDRDRASILFMKAIGLKVRALAEVSADQMLADGVIDANELEQLL